MRIFSTLLLLYSAPLLGTVIKAPTDCSTRPCVYTHTCVGATCTAGEVTEFINDAFEDSQLGDTIILEAGKKYPISIWELTARAGSGTLTIQSSDIANLPDALITPEQTSSVPTFEATGATSAILIPAHSSPVTNIEFKGIRVTMQAGNNITHSNGLIRVGGKANEVYGVDAGADTLSGGVAAWITNDTQFSCSATSGLSAHTNYYVINANGTTFQLSETQGGSAFDLSAGSPSCRPHWLEAWKPTGIVFDRLIINMDKPQAFSSGQELARGMLLDAGDVTIKNSWLDDAGSDSGDTQVILISSGGPYTFTNDYFGYATENIMCGGAPASVLAQTCNGVMKGNIFAKSPIWRQEQIGWEADHYYPIGSLRRPSNLSSQVMMARNSGTSGGSEPSWPASTLGLTVEDNGITWEVVNLFTVPKNALEFKTGRDWNVINNGFYWHWQGSQSETVVLKASHISSTGQETPAFRTGTVNTDGTAVTWVSGDTLPCQSGNAAAEYDSIFINSIEYEFDDSLWNSTGCTDTSLTLLTSAPTEGPVTFTYGDTADNHQESEMSNYFIGYNNIRYSPHFALVRNAAGVQVGDNSNILFTGNLGREIGVPWGNAGTRIIWSVTANISVFVKEHNTFIRGQDPDLAYAISWAGGSWSQDEVFRNNITAGFPIGTARAGGQSSVSRYMCFDDGCTSLQFDENIFAGGQTSTYTDGTHYNACPSTASCNDPDYTTIFKDFANNDFHVVSPYIGTATDGIDIGANPDLVPEIVSHRVEVGDTSAIIRIKVSGGVLDYPCVARVSTIRDLRTLIADQDASLFSEPYSDNQPGSPDGVERIIPIGIRSALTPSTTYYYGLYCGGAQLDVPWHDVVYSFTTTAALSSTGDITLNGIPTSATTDNRILRYGTSYVRSTDTIQSPSLGSQVACTTSGPCTVSLTANKGDLIYYRVLDRNSTSVLSSGPVQMSIVR